MRILCFLLMAASAAAQTKITPAQINWANSDIRALWTGTCNSITFLRGDGACAAPVSLADPGSNGIVKRTALNTTAPAVAGTDYLSPSAANTMTRGQTITGSQDEVQMDITCNATQTNPCVRARTSAGDNLLQLNNDGSVNIGSGGGSSSYVKLSGSTSGSITLTVPAVAGADHTVRMPTTNGSAGQYVKTDGGSPAQWSYGAPVASTSQTLKGDGSGGAVGIGSSASDCVHPDGSATACGGYDPFDWNTVQIRDDLCEQVGGTGEENIGTLKWIVYGDAGLSAPRSADANWPCIVTVTTNALAAQIARVRPVSYYRLGGNPTVPGINPSTFTNFDVQAVVKFASVTDISFDFYFVRNDLGSTYDCGNTSTRSCFGINFDSATDTHFVARSCNDSSTCTTSTTASPVVAINTTYVLRLWSTVAGTVHYSVNGTEIGTGISTNVASYTMAAGLGVKGNAKSFGWRGWAIKYTNLGNE